MFRLLLPALAAFAVLSIASDRAEACGDTGCQALVVAAVATETANEAPAPTVAPAADEAEVRARDLAKKLPKAPAFWMQFKSYAYKKLPTHQEKSFTAVWIGMAVETPDETVAGVGVQGVWW